MADYDVWAPDYDVWAAEMTEDVPFYVSLAHEAAEPIVELAVGTGRVAIAIARETGKRVIGIDRSPAMLAVGRERAGDLPVELREGDFRDFTVEQPVELVVCPFRSLLHAPTWADKRAVFDAAARALKPGGRFAWNAFVFSPFVAAANHGRRSELEDGRWEGVRQVPADNRVDLTRGRGDRADGTVRLWWATRSEWEGLVEAAGLEVEALYGWFDRRPFDEDSAEFVFVARKPTA
ncbi:MAG TPA: class I SAM-dependent methyltransferase [Gaiellaceae bacterium]|nr:class I SAM-dependent methyltransferase [Gaiellaceae bacterium]